MERYRSGHNGAVLKTVRVKTHGGSNPSRSAICLTSPSGEVISLKEVQQMKHSKGLLFLCLMLAAVLLAGCSAAKGSVKVRQGNDLSKTVDLTALTCEPVRGSSVDENGKSVEIDTTGVLVSDVLQAANIDSSWIGNISVQSRDKQTVEVTGSELNMASKAYLTPQDDGTWSLVVLSDDDDGFMLRDVVYLHAENI